MISSLLRPEAYDHPVDRVDVMETHISWVLLTGPFAYKIKKPVNFGFVDFGTLDRRRWFCDEEVRLNRRLAAALYCGVRAIFGPGDQATLVGGGTPIDWAVQMRQFSQDALAAAALARGHLSAGHWNTLADELADFQAAAATAGSSIATDATPAFGSPEMVRAPAQANLDALAPCPAAVPRRAALQQWTDQTFDHLKPIFMHRQQTGRIREGHGDLHLGNLVFLEGRLIPFDCLEFNPELRWIDVISDLAFLHMDLAEHGQSLMGAGLLNRWLDRTGDYAGLSTWRWYIVYRALVRAKVNALRLGQPGLSTTESAALTKTVEEYLEFAHAAATGSPGRLFITHGVSGSGKSHLSRLLVERLGWLHLRSDAERKRLFGQWGAGTDQSIPLTADHYRPHISEHLYGEVLPAHAASTLQAGFSVIVDATFLDVRHRAVMAEVAARAGTTMHILDCRVSESVAKERIEERNARGGDPSDANAAVLAHQLASAAPLTPEEQSRAIIVDSATGIDAAVAAVERGPRLQA